MSTAVEAILNDALYQNHTRPNQNDLSNIELALEKIVGSTFGNLAGILDSSDIQTYSSTYQETVQYAKLNFNKCEWVLLPILRHMLTFTAPPPFFWHPTHHLPPLLRLLGPLLLGIFGSFISLVLATVLLRPLPDDAPFVKGTDLLHITRWEPESSFPKAAEARGSKLGPRANPLLPLLVRLLAISDIPGKLRDSSASRKELRQIGQGIIVSWNFVWNEREIIYLRSNLATPLSLFSRWLSIEVEAL